MSIAMDRFVHRANLYRYRQELAMTTEEVRRQQLLKLLAEEEAKGPPPAGPKQPKEK